MAIVSSASGTSRWRSSAKIASTSTTMMSRKIAPKAANRRISEMSELDARQQLARLPAVVEADLEALEVLVEVVADACLDVGRDVGEVEAPAVREPELEEAEHDGEREERPSPAVFPSLIGPSIAAATMSGIASCDADRRDRRDRDEHDLGDVRPQIWQNSPERSLPHGTPQARQRGSKSG